MAEPATDARAALEALEESYALHFADQPRLTRAPGLLLALQREVESLLPQLKGPLRATAEGQRRRYADELRSVRAAQDQAGPDGCALAALRQRLHFVEARWAQHFAGQPRPSRDLGLLAALAAEVAALAARAAPLAPPEDPVRVGLAHLAALMATEAEAVAAARGAGDGASQAYWLGAAINTLVARFQAAVEGRRLLACSPELVQGLVDQMAALAAALAALPAPAGAPAPHAEHVAAAAAMAADWRAALVGLLDLHGRASAAERAAALSADLDACLAAYNAAQAAAELPAALRAKLLSLREPLFDLEAQLGALAAAGTPEAAEAALVATDALALVLRQT